MDSGDVIPGLNEDWTFGGAKMFEWLAGLMMAFLVSGLFNRPAHYMPLLVITWIGTTFFLAGLRRQFPDEERGIRNVFMVACGFAPPGIPSPSKLQPRWSGRRMESLPKCTLVELGIDEVLTRGSQE